MKKIHTSAIVHPEACIGNNVEIGPFSIIEKNVHIGDDCKIGSHVLIASGTSLASGCRVFKGAVLGTDPQDLKFGGEESRLEVGERVVIREFATLNRGTKDKGVTKVGSDCLIMAYVHIAHDCEIGDRVILANAVNLAGHVVIEDDAGIGGMTPVHQFVHIGSHCFIGGGFRAHKDVPPFILASGDPLGYAGLNSVGLRRKNFSSETRSLLKQVYKIIFRSGLNMNQALERVQGEFMQTKEVREVIQFIGKSQRGIIRS